MRLSQVGAVGLLMIASASFAAAEVIEVNDGYRVERCGYPANTSYTVTNSRTGLKQGGSTNGQGCVKTTFRNEKAQAGDHLLVSVAGHPTEAEVVPGSAQAPAPRDPGGVVPPRPRDPSSPRPTPPKPRDPTPFPPEPRDPDVPPQPRPPTPRPPTPRPPTPRPPEPRPPEPTLPAESVFTAKNVAKNQARMMANRVVAVYGRAEQVLYSFSLGLNQGIASYNFENGGVRQNADFLLAAQRGQNEGQTAGYARGEREGRTEGQYAGSSAAALRFESVIDKGTPPDLNPGAPAIPIRSYQAEVADPATLEELLNRHNNELYLILNGYDYSYEDYYARNIWGSELVTMAQIYNWRSSFGFNRFIDSYSRDEWALDAWLNYRLGGRYQNEVRYYNRVTDPSQVSNAGEVRAAFISEFKRTYRETIDDKWLSSVRRVDPVVQSRGLQLGYVVSREHATDLGRVYGYRAAFPAASSQGFQSSFSGAYVNHFNSSVNYYQQNLVVSNAALQIVTEGGAPFLPFAPLHLKITQLSNAGQLGGEPVVQISGGHTKAFQKKARAIKASSSDVVPQLVEWVGQVDYSVVPNEINNVEIAIGNFKASATYTVSMYDVVKALGQAADENARLTLTEYIRKNLAAQFEVGAQDALLGELANAFNGLAYNEKMTFIRSRDSFKSAYGREPSIFSSKRGRWQKAQALLNSLR